MSPSAGEATPSGRVRPGLGTRLGVVAGGAVGTLLRAGLSAVAPAGAGGVPWGTVTANLLGALLLGVLVGATETRETGLRHTVPAIGTGLLGAFTTFSALSIETVELAERSPALGASYLVASLLAGVVLASAGRRTGTRLVTAGAS